VIYLYFDRLARRWGHTPNAPASLEQADV